MRVRRTPVLASIIGLVLTGCAAQGERAAAPVNDTEAAGSDDALTVDQVLADIAAMDLTYDERIAYLEERAHEEGGLLFYSSMNVGTNEAWAEGFRAAYPDLDYRFVGLGRPADLLERVRAEHAADRHLVDVVQGAAVGAALQAEGYVAAHHGVPVPDAYPEDYVEDFGVLITFTPQVITWNTDLVTADAAARAWDDFLEPDHAGCVHSGGPSWVATMIAERGYDDTEDWLQRFLANDGVLEVASTSGNTRALAAGEYDCMVYSHTHTVEAMIVDDGAPLEWYVPESTPTAAQRIYIARQARSPHAAALFVHWVLGEQGAQVLADDGRIPLYPGVEPAYERLRPFADVGSDIHQRLVILDSEEALRIEDDALALLETYAVPSADGD